MDQLIRRKKGRVTIEGFCIWCGNSCSSFRTSNYVVKILLIILPSFTVKKILGIPPEWRSGFRGHQKNGMWVLKARGKCPRGFNFMRDLVLNAQDISKASMKNERLLAPKSLVKTCWNGNLHSNIEVKWNATNNITDLVAQAAKMGYPSHSVNRSCWSSNLFQELFQAGQKYGVKYYMVY